jgi:hypothetical protein
MKSFRKNAKAVLLVVAAVFVICQFIRIDKQNPPIISDIPADSTAKSILKQACYDCHSNETKWPWYSNVAPVSWLISNDVKEGRKHLNFSEWGSYSSEKQLSKLDDIRDELRQGEMPLWYYSLMHPRARIKQNEREKIIAGIAGLKQ